MIEDEFYLSSFFRIEVICFELFGDRLSVLTSQYLQTTALKVVEDLPTDSIALVCQGLNCLAPSVTLEDLQTQIQHSMMRD